MSPLDALTRDPVVAFNLTLLLFWAVSGWAMSAVTFRLTRRHLAALVFTVCPARLGYNVFQVQLLFGIPLSVYTLVRFLETQRVRYLAGLLAVFWLQAMAVVYYGVILGLGLGLVTVQYAALRWRGWGLRTFLAAAIGAAGLVAALAPVAWPYFVTHRQLGLERSPSDALKFTYSADLLAYLTTDGTWLWRIAPIAGASEAPLFVGLGPLVLVAVSLLGIRGREPPWARWAARLVAGGAWAALAAANRPARSEPRR
jgi:hypothetical protein